MEFEDLKSIWDTQNDKPVFSMQDQRLVVALYQQRERADRRIFKEQFMPVYVMVPGMLAFLAFLCFAFFMKSLHIKDLGRDFPMSAWDYAAFAGAAVSLLAVVALMHAERKKHNRTQQVFAPSLREELDRGIAQLDFELSLQNTGRVYRILVPVFVVASVICWEAGRLNGEATPWNFVFVTLALCAVSTWAGFAAKKKIVERVTARRRALESMLAALDEEEM